MSADFSKIIMALAEEKLRYIAAHRERLVEAWIAETGLLPSESMLVEQNMQDGTTRVWIERQDAEMNAKIAANRALVREQQDDYAGLRDTARAIVADPELLAAFIGGQTHGAQAPSTPAGRMQLLAMMARAGEDDDND